MEHTLPGVLHSWQAIYPTLQERIINATTPEELANIVSNFLADHN